MTEDSTFIMRLDPGSATGPVLAVKDLIDIAGTVTTAGSKVVAKTAMPAVDDAPLLLGARSADARIIGKTNLVELALGVSGINPWFGTPINPLDTARVPGGSSSGSAVAVASGEAQVAYGSDTGGSIRLPAACCGVVGLKTTFGRVSLEGVWPLAPSLDSVGPMGRSVADVVLGMQLLEPGFVPGEASGFRVGRLHLPATPGIDKAIDDALVQAGFEVEEVELPRWFEAWDAAMTIIEHEAWVSNGPLHDQLSEIDPAVAKRLERGAQFSPEVVSAARETATRWIEDLEALFSTVELLATPTLPDLPPLLSEAANFRVPHLSPVNLSQLPAIALPVGRGAPVPPSLQLIAPMRGEERLVTAAALLEASAPR